MYNSTFFFFFLYTIQLITNWLATNICLDMNVLCQYLLTKKNVLKKDKCQKIIEEYEH